MSVPQRWSLEYPTYSPDGKQLAVLAFDQRARLRVSLLDDGTLRPLPFSADLSDYAWMPDSERMLIAVGLPMRRSSLSIVDLDGSLIESIVLSRALSIEDGGMAVASDGESAVVSAVALVGDRTELADLFRVELRSGRVTQLTSTPEVIESFPLILRGGRTLYVATSGDRLTSLVMSTESGDSRALTSAPVWFDRAGADESGGLVLASGFPQGSSLAWRVYAIRGTNAEVLSAVTEGIRWLAVRPDGQELAGVVPGPPGESGTLLIEPVPDS